MADQLLKLDDALAKYDPTFGIEVHVELSTKTKMFCPAPNPAFDNNLENLENPNSMLCPASLGLPGALPVLNKTAVEYAIKIGLALNCEIAEKSVFSRKQYFYPDLTKNFQTSQYDLPTCVNGFVEVILEDGEKFIVEIERAHLEEDAGKNNHIGGETGRIQGAEYSLVDYNRAGVPLVEIVSRPVVGAGKRAPEVAAAYVRTLRDIFKNLGVSNAQMERGNVRADVNLSLSKAGQQLVLEPASALVDSATDAQNDGKLNPTRHPAGGADASQDPLTPDVISESGTHRLRTAYTPAKIDFSKLGTRTETKNVNSFSAIEAAANYEIRRQAAILEAGQSVTQETRMWQEASNSTTAGRPKSDADDYRYFPEPDLPPLFIDAEAVAEAAKDLPEAPHLKRARLKADYGFSDLEMRDVVNAGALDLIEATVNAGATPAGARKWWMTGLSTFASENELTLDEVAEKHATPQVVAELDGLINDKTINDKIARQVLDAILTGDPAAAKGPAAFVEAKGLKVVSDDGPLIKAIEEAFAAQPAVLEDIKSGNQAGAGRIIGAVMKATGGAADGGRVRELIMELANK